MAKTLTQLIAAVRQLSNTENSGFVTDAEITERVKEAYLELYDIVVDSFETYFLSSASYTLTSTPTGAVAALPADMYKALGLDRDPGTTRSRTVDRLHSYYERNAPGRLSYDIDGDNLYVFPYSDAAGSYALRYVPTAPAIVDDVSLAALPSALQKWELFVQLHPAVAILDKREMDSSSLQGRLATLKGRIVDMAKRRDVEPKQVPLVRRRNYGQW